MTPRTSALLAAVGVVVLAAGLLFGTGNREQQAAVPASRPAFPGLAAKLPEAARIEIERHGTTLALALTGDLWTLPGSGGYRAGQAQVHELLASLAALSLAEPRTSDADDYPRLGVEDAQGKDGSATLVRLLDGNGGAIAQILVGKQRPGSSGTGDGVYVRRPGEAQAWLANGRLSADADAQQWIDRDIIDIPLARIATVTVSHGAQTLVFARDGAGIVLKAPSDHGKLDQFKLDGIGRGLEALSLTGVKPAPAPGKPSGQALYTTGDGLAVRVTVSKAGADVWAEVSVSGTSSEAAALQAKVKGWAYQLDAGKEDALVPTLQSLQAYAPPSDAPK